MSEKQDSRHKMCEVLRIHEKDNGSQSFQLGMLCVRSFNIRKHLQRSRVLSNRDARFLTDDMRPALEARMQSLRANTKDYPSRRALDKISSAIRRNMENMYKKDRDQYTKVVENIQPFVEELGLEYVMRYHHSIIRQ